MRRSILVIACVVALVLVATPASADVLFEDYGLANGGDTVFAGHPASGVGACPYLDTGEGLDGGCMEQYDFNIPSTSDESNRVEIEVGYNTARFSNDPCVKSADLDLFLFDPDGNIIDNHKGCDPGSLRVVQNDLQAGNYVVEVRGRWGAVVDYSAKGTLTHTVN